MLIRHAAYPARCAVLALALTAVQTSPAEDRGGMNPDLDRGSRVTIPEIMRRAESQSEILRAKLLAVRADEARGDQATTWQNPTAEALFGRIGAGGSYGPLFEMRIFQPFYLPGKNDKRRAIFAAILERSRSEAAEFKLLARYEAVRLAYGYAATDEIGRHLTERAERLRLLSAFLRSRPFAAPQQMAQKALVERKLEKVEKSLREAELARDRLWLQLNLYLNYDERKAVAVTWFTRGPDLAAADILARALEANPTLLQKRAAVKEQEAVLALSHAEAYPDFGLAAIYRTEGGPSGNRYYGAGVTLPLPIFNRNQHAIRASELSLEAAKEALQFETRLVRTKISETYAGYAAARVNLAAFPLSHMSRSDAEMNQIELGFRKGRVDFLTFLEAENETFETHLRVFAAQLDLIQNYTALLLAGSSPDFQVE